MAFMIMPIYNIDQPVGRGEANLADDVKLVQTLLVELSKVTPAGNGWPPSARLTTDGRYTETLTDWILTFQRLLATVNPGRVVCDGKVHPMPMDGSRDWSSKFSSGVFSTLFSLNRLLRDKASEVHTQLATRLGLRESGVTS